MDVLELLKEDHRKVKKILEELTDTTERAVKTRGEKLRILEKEFLIHASFEESIFYPTVKNEEATKDLILEAYEEHHEVKLMLKELNKLAFEDEKWKPRLTVIKENIEHHVKEEENELFPKVKKLLSTEKLSLLGEQLKKFKAESKN